MIDATVRRRLVPAVTVFALLASGCASSDGAQENLGDSPAAAPLHGPDRAPPGDDQALDGRPLPRPFTTPMLSSNRRLTLMLRADGSVWGCGVDASLFTGVSDTGYPVRISAPRSAGWVSSGHGVGFLGLRAFGDNSQGELGFPAPTGLPNLYAFQQPAYHPPVSGKPVAGYWVTYYVAGGKVYAAGENIWGQLGNGAADTNAHSTYTTVQTAGGADLTDVSFVVAGSDFAAALKHDGTVWTWGGNQWGQLGDGTLVDRHFAAQVAGLPRIVAISASTGRDRGNFLHDHVLALAADGTVWAWGENRDGELGNGAAGAPPGNPAVRTAPVTSPVQVLTGAQAPLSRVVAVATGGAHSLALRSDGTVWSWGYNGTGQLGYGTYAEGANSYAAKIPSLANVRGIAAGPSGSFATDPLYRVRSWGFNYYYRSLCVGPEPTDLNPADAGRDPRNFITSPTLVKLENGTVFTLK